MGEHLHGDEIARLAREVATGVPPERSELPDTPVVREKRAKLTEQIEAIKASGHAVDLPHEWPDPVTPARS